MYDLKGSTNGRRTDLSDSEVSTGNSSMKVLKDLNFMDLKEAIEIDQERKAEIHRVLQADVKFLAENNLMDYSLLFMKVDV